MLNIPSTNTDPAYRYKMPKIQSKLEGRGNGSKTCVINMGDVARAIQRPPQYTTKWFGTELGAQSTYTKREGEGERAVINGHHSTEVFQTALDKFIDKYVLCQNCRLPEINMAVKKGSITAKCMACGWAGDLDTIHKVSTFMLKNPPNASGMDIVNSNDAGGKPDKKARREAKIKARNGKDNDSDAGSDSGEGSEKKVKKSKKEDKEKKDKKEKKEKKEKKDKKDKKDKKEKKNKKEKEESHDGSDVDSGSEDDSTSRVKKGNVGEDTTDALEYDDEETQKIIRNLVAFCEKKNDKPTTDEFFEELRIFQVAKVFDNKVRMYIVLETFFGTLAATNDSQRKQRLTVSNLKTRSKIIYQCVQHGSVPTSDVLWAFDAYLNRYSEAVSKVFPLVLKELYDLEVCTEKDILEYYNEDIGQNQPGFAEAKRIVEPFLQWLANDDSDDSDNSSDESD